MMPSVEFDFEGAATDWLKELEDIGPVISGVASYGDAAAYALVWELG
jgi:hypothetical protein